MPLYNCECCDYSTKIKSHFSRHILTKKHTKNMEKIKKQKVEKNKLSNIEKRTCIYCDKIMSTPYSLKRHIENSCIKNKESKKNKKNEDSEKKQVDVEFGQYMVDKYVKPMIKDKKNKKKKNKKSKRK